MLHLFIFSLFLTVLSGLFCFKFEETTRVFEISFIFFVFSIIFLCLSGAMLFIDAIVWLIM